MKGLRRLVADIEDVDSARARADAARVRLKATIDEIQARAAPSRLLDDALAGVRTRSVEIARSTGDAVRKRPVATAATGVGIGLLLTAGPLTRLIRRLRRGKEATSAPDRQFNP
jgi:ElaB/YqjD/DUF883 family membrane-anchored ribosome-binding protein